MLLDTELKFLLVLINVSTFYHSFPSCAYISFLIDCESSRQLIDSVKRHPRLRLCVMLEFRCTTRSAAEEFASRRLTLSK